MKVQLSTLWIFVILNIISADILSFMYPGTLEGIMTAYAEQVKITPEFLLLAAGLLEIPIAMLVLSRALPYRVNRWANIIAGIVMIAFVIGGGSATLHYLFFASIGVACLAFIVWSAWHWRTATERSPSTTPNYTPYGENA